MHNTVAKLLSAAIVAVLLAGFGIFSLYKNVSLEVNGVAHSYSTTAWTVGDLLNNNGLLLNDDEIVEPNSATVLKDGMKIRILQAVPVKLIADGHTIEKDVYAATVSEALKRLGVSYDNDDRLSVNPKAKLKPDMVIQLVRVDKKQVQEEVPIAYLSKNTRSDRLRNGEIKVLTKGQNGVKEIKVENTYENGVLKEAKVLSEKVLKEPVGEVVAFGGYVPVSRGNAEMSRYMVFKASAYDPSPASCGAYADGYTATGVRAGKGIVAVDPDVIPLHSRLYIEDYGYAVAEDTGGKINGRRIDLCFDTYREAMQFGRREVKVYFLD